MARKYRNLHNGYLVRWVMSQFPFGVFQLNVRLGKPTDEVSNGVPEQYKGLAQNYQLIADCVAIYKGKVFIIEAIVRPNEWFKLAQLNAYERAFRKTERYKEHWDWPIEKILLITDTNELMESEASEYGIKVVKYTMPDVENYLNTLYKWQREPRGSGLKAV